MAQIDNVFYPRVALNTPQNTAYGSTYVSGVSLSVTGVVSSFSATAFPNTVKLVFMDVQNSSVTVTFDTTNPAVGTRGHLLQPNTNYTWNAQLWQNAKFITGATTATLFATAVEV